MNQVLKMSFTEIYRRPELLEALPGEILDFAGLEGTRGYCSEEAAEVIRGRIAPYGPCGVHLLDSGNYHYLSLFWLETVTEPFDLIVWDHHTDLQESALFGLLSCGSWILEAVRTIQNLRSVLVIGPPQASIDELPEEVRSRVEFVPEEELFDKESDRDNPECFADERAGEEGACKEVREKVPGKELLRRQTKMLEGDLPVYLSLDRDVFSKDVIETDWDQGIMRLEDFLEDLTLLMENRQIIGLDICGEPEPEERGTLLQKSRACTEKIFRKLDK